MENFDVLVVDPPWAYGSSTGRGRTAERHYETLGSDGREVNRRTGAGIESIISTTPVRDWASPNAQLYLWTTNPKLPFAFAVMAAWGFTYKTTLTWVKTKADGSLHRGGMGFFYRGATEHVLLGIRGRYPIPPELREPNVIFAPTGEHSEKPDEFYQLVERVTPGARRIDVYARKARRDWALWGLEAPRPYSQDAA